MKCKHVIRIEKSFGRYTEGQLVHIALDAKKQVTDRFWRARLADAEYDGSCVLLEDCLGSDCRFKTAEVKKKKAKGKRPVKSAD